MKQTIGILTLIVAVIAAAITFSPKSDAFNPPPIGSACYHRMDGVLSPSPYYFVLPGTALPTLWCGGRLSE